MSWLPLQEQIHAAELPAPILIDSFLGVDFRGGDVEIDSRRSPDALNMIFGPQAGLPQKRTGYTKVIDQALPGVIYGIHQFTGEETQLLVHSGTGLYRIQEDTALLLYEGMSLARSRSFTMNGVLYLLDGERYLCYDGKIAEPVCNRAYIPTTVIGRKPTGGGTPLESVNLLTGWRINRFIGDGVSTNYQLEGEMLSDSPLGITVDGQELLENEDYTVDRFYGIVTFQQAPPEADAGAGISNVVISYELAGSLVETIDRCTVCGIFGGDNDTRVFVSGNPDRPGMDWQSGLYDPTYFPDTGYTRVGTDAAPILGYVKQYNTQIILKAGNGQEAVQYLRTFALDDNGTAVFPICQGTVGVGALAPGSFAALLDEPLFLSQDGVRAVVGTSVDLQRNLQPRSDLIDPKLLQEPHLEDAQAVVLGDRYYLFIEGHVYVADARLRREDELGQIQYEWHYWEGIPAFSVFSDGKDLWFGSKEGYVYRMLKETEKRCYLDDGAPIQCRWTTPFFSFGCWDRKKTLTEISVTMLPFTKSSCQICYATQGHSEQVQEEVVEDILGFEDVDFNRFTFKTLRFPHTHRIRSREKRFQLFRLTLRNQDTGQGEGFGLVAIQMSCRLSSKIK